MENGEHDLSFSGFPVGERFPVWISQLSNSQQGINVAATETIRIMRVRNFIVSKIMNPMRDLIKSFVVIIHFTIS
jgi:hypothetical protein